MMAPLPSSMPLPDRPELPRVRLEVRTGSGRAMSYEVGSAEFLIGGASGCDLRLTTPIHTAVIAQITRKPEGVHVRRLASLPVLLNDTPLASNTATPISNHDCLTIAGVEIAITIQYASYLSPKLVRLDPQVDPPVFTSRQLDERERVLEDETAARREECDRRDAELVRRQRDLDRQTEELEADRLLWYQRRQEMEEEAEGIRALALAVPRELTLREQELAHTRDELNGLREQLTQEQEQLRAARSQLEQDRAAFETDQQRRSELEADHAERINRAEGELLDRHRAKLEDLDRFQESLQDSAAKLAERRDQFEAELADRRKRADDEAAERLLQADAEIARRRAALEAELADHQPKLADFATDQARLTSGLQELTRQREIFAADREILDRSRESFEASRAAETERLESWEKTLAERETDLARRDAALRADREAFDTDRQQVSDDLLRLDRRRAEAEVRERDLDARVRDADLRVEQLKRDAAEWEETVRQAAAEQDRLRAEAERLDRQKAELDTQTAKLGERAAQLEAQQAVLAVLRAKLDRTRGEVEREASALATARVREDEAQAELRARILEAEQLRADLNIVQETAAQERRRLEERDSLLAAGLEEIRIQKDALATEEARLGQREADLDVRSAEFAEQAGTLKGRMAQALDLQARLEADRVAIRERETALAQAEDARQNLQEQLRRRAEDLSARTKALDEVARQLAADRSAAEQARTVAEAQIAAAMERAESLRQQAEIRAAEVDRQVQTVAEREAALARQVVRVQEVGQAVAGERKALADARSQWEADRTTAEAAARTAREELDTFRTRVTTEIDALRAEAPELEGQAKAALDRLTAAKDTLRGHLTELNDFARQSRADLEVVRAQVRIEADRLRTEEATLDRARAEHRLAVTAFRQQLVDWQGKVAEMKQGLARQESRLEARQAAVDQAARQVDATSQHLAEEKEQLKRDQEEVVQKRTEVERHLADMREWYRKKLRELAQARGTRSAERGAGNGEPERGTRNAETEGTPEFGKPRLAAIDDTGTPDSVPQTSPANPTDRVPNAVIEELEPGDRHLGELLRSLELVDADTLTALWTEASRQRRTLRQVLLASGAVTLYQLALIEAGNLDGLMLGRLRVIDRLRVTPREAMYRVLDPARADGKSGGVFLLRHLSDSEMQDAIHPDEFRQRFAAARDAAHPNLAATVEVLDVNGRPAVLQEWLTGLFSADWPAQAAHPGCWVRLVTMAAEGIESAHRFGLAHGRLTSDSFVLTTSGVLKVTGFGEPPWLSVGPAPVGEPTPPADLRSLGQVVFGWSQLAARKKGGRAAKSFPAELVGVIRRLEADAEPPMGDTVAADRPYSSATELVADLNRIARETGFSDDAWDKLLRHVAENAPDAPAILRQSA